MLTLKEFKEARGVLSGVIRNTSLVYSPAFSKATGNQIYIKPEYAGHRGLQDPGRLL